MLIHVLPITTFAGKQKKQDTPYASLGMELTKYTQTTIHQGLSEFLLFGGTMLAGEENGQTSTWVTVEIY